MRGRVSPRPPLLETLQEGYCGRQPEEILAQHTLGYEKITLNMGELRVAHVETSLDTGHSNPGTVCSSEAA